MHYAHISSDGRTQELTEHLENVALLAKDFASVFGAQQEGYAIGKLHDIGKFSKEFDKRLHGGAKVDHSTAGAIELFNMHDLLGAICVAGHHGGIPDLGRNSDIGGASLFARVKSKNLPDYCAFKDEIEVPCPSNPKLADPFEIAFYIRMLYSCLTDADFLDTEAFMLNGNTERNNFDSIDVLYDKFCNYIKKFKHPKSELDFLRNDILNTCISFGKTHQNGVYSFTIPTGGGKTISSLAMALNNAIATGANHIIYVVPYTNIIEQISDEFRNIFGYKNVLEHHSSAEILNYDDCDENPTRQSLRLSTENWDAPIIVTTNVQFFESLYSNRVSRCRKLHNIANSVIIFDEAQMIPIDYLRPCVYGIAELTKHYRCTAILCTATQPSLNPYFAERNVAVSEIYPNTSMLFSKLKRTVIKSAGVLSCQELADKMSLENHILAIASTRKQAEELFQCLPAEGRFHLSTLVTPYDRRSVIAEIRHRLTSDNLPCRVAATSVVEAGVDLDFTTVFRAEAGLDSIIQAAGRCNREGKLPAEESCVYVYTPDGNVPKLLGKNIAILHEIEQRFSDISSPEAIKAYFDCIHNLQKDLLDKKGILDITAQGLNGSMLPFEEIASRFKLIESDTSTVLIPENDEAKEFAENFFSGKISKTLFRRASKYCVNVYINEFSRLIDDGNAIKISESLAILTNPNLYSSESGLKINENGGDALFL